MIKSIVTSIIQKPGLMLILSFSRHTTARAMRRLIASKVLLPAGAFAVCLLCHSTTIRAQETVRQIAQQFNAYGSEAFSEKIFLHTDKSFYLAGEVLWFKAYYVDGIFNRPSDLSKVAYVELFDDHNKPVMQGKIPLQKGSGNGSFFLPSSLPTGQYTLRAYTNWMKNFGADYFFEQPVSIVNSLKPLPAAVKDTLQRSGIRFFPEGGNLVQGIAGKVAFQGLDKEGHGLAFSGVITNQRNETIARFEPAKFGIGFFMFTPVAGDTYTATIQSTNGQTTVAALPAALPQGYSMLTEEGPGETIRVTISTQAGSNDRAVYLLAHNKQVVKLAERKVLEHGRCVFSFNRTQLGEGVSQLTVFNENRQPVCERSYFVYPRTSLSIATSTDAPLYGPRQPINLAVTTQVVATAGSSNTSTDAQAMATITSSAGVPSGAQGVLANLSLSVYRIEPLPALPVEHINSYLWLSADLKGRVESPEYYFTAVDKSVTSAMDNLMLVHGWRKFNWEPILSGQRPAFAYKPEFDGQLIAGKISYNTADSTAGAPATGVRTYLSIPGTKLQFYPAVSDAQGNLHFDVREYYGPGEIILQAESDSNYRFDVTNPFFERYRDVAGTIPVASGVAAVAGVSGTATPAGASGTTGVSGTSGVPNVPGTSGAISSAATTSADRFTGPGPLGLSAAQEKPLTESSINMQVQNAFFGERISQFAIPSVDTTPFFGRNSRSYLLDDYVRFTTTEEILREYVPDVAVRKSGGHFLLYVFNWEIERHYKSMPLVLIDGVPVSIDKLMAYDPLKMRRLQVMTDRFVSGEFVFDGIISFTTYHGDLDELKLDAKAVIMDYDGLQLSREFYAPVYETAAQKASRLPDHRNVLLWKPDIQTDASGKARLRFYSSDLKGTFIGVLQGIDQHGQAGSHTFTFEVK